MKLLLIFGLLLSGISCRSSKFTAVDLENSQQDRIVFSQPLPAPMGPFEPIPEGEIAPPPINEVKKNEAEVTSPDLTSEEFVLQGELTPTIYYKPLIVDAEDRCSSDDRVVMQDKQGLELLKLCPRDYDQCLLQGSCTIQKQSEEFHLNYQGQLDGEVRFFLDDSNRCHFGYGVKSICLDPMYSVAADLEFHNPGDVLYVPAIKGLKLEDGSIHEGYFIVRDRGGAIKGPHRFDFFTGLAHWQDKNNPLASLGLADKQTNLPYYKVSGETAAAILKQRNYPNLPEN